MNKILFPFLFAACLSIASCGDDDEPQIPSEAITLNMMNEANGQTRLGNSDVYIDMANNFTSDQCGIVDMGRKGSFDRQPDLTQVSYQMAVTPGNYYQVMPASSIREVAGQRAFPVGETYYNVYADSWIKNKDGDIAGAKVSYMERTPRAEGLPDWEEKIPITLDGILGEYTFHEQAVIDPEYDFWAQYPDELGILIDGNKIQFRYAAYSNDPVDVWVNVRLKSLYTSVHFVIQ